MGKMSAGDALVIQGDLAFPKGNSPLLCPNVFLSLPFTYLHLLPNVM